MRRQAPGVTGVVDNMKAKMAKMANAAVGKLTPPPIKAPAFVQGQESRSEVAKLIRGVEEFTDRPATQFGWSGIRRVDELDDLARQSRAGNNPHGEPKDFAARKFAEVHGEKSIRILAKKRSDITRRRTEYEASAQGRKQYTAHEQIGDLLAHARRVSPGGQDVPLAEAKLLQETASRLVDRVSYSVGGATDVVDGTVSLSWREAKALLPGQRLDSIISSVRGKRAKAAAKQARADKKQRKAMTRAERKVDKKRRKAEAEPDGIEVPLSAAEIADKATDAFMDANVKVHLYPRKLNAKQSGDILRSAQESSGALATNSGKVDPTYAAVEKTMYRFRDKFPSDGRAGKAGDDLVVRNHVTGEETLLKGWSAENQRSHQALEDIDEMIFKTGVKPGEVHAIPREQLIAPLAEKLSKLGDGSSSSVALANGLEVIHGSDVAARRALATIGASRSYEALLAGSKVLHVMIGGAGPRASIHRLGDFARVRSDPFFRALAKDALKGKEMQPGMLGDAVHQGWSGLPPQIRSITRSIARAGADTLEDAVGMRGGLLGSTIAISSNATPPAGPDETSDPSEDLTVDDILVVVGLVESQLALAKAGAYDLIGINAGGSDE
jgi:hypothetical protein